MSQLIDEDVLEAQLRWERDLEERWQAKELLKTSAASEEARRHAQDRLTLAPLPPPPSMQWALHVKKPLPSHDSPGVVPAALHQLRSRQRA